MKVTAEELPKREVLLNIEMDQDELDPYMERAFRRAAQQLNIPGFRKGKAPRAVVEPYVGRETLMDDALEILMPEALEKAVAQESLEQGGIPHVEIVTKEPVVFKATVPLMPKVVLDAYREIRQPRESVEVSEEQLKETLEHLRWELAPWEPAERPVALEDRVTLDVRAVVDGREVTNQKGVVYMARADNPNPVLGFAQELVGMEQGQSKEFSIAFPEGYEDAGLVGKDCAYSIAVHEVKEKKLPDLDDEFAKGVGQGFDTLEALREDIRNGIRTQEEEAARRRYEDAVIEQLVSRTTVELSDLIVEHEVEHLLYDEQESLRRQQVGMEQYLQTVGKSSEEHHEEAREAVLKRLNRGYALRQLAELESLTASTDEVEEEKKTLLEAAGPQAVGLRRELDSPDGLSSLGEAIVRRKAVARLVEIAEWEADSPKAATTRRRTTRRVKKDDETVESAEEQSDG
ncbi:MAG: trigger factor [Chloroflexi bacterium]|nr:trigger factor [Chloroflexota bacterium]